MKPVTTSAIVTLATLLKERVGLNVRPNGHAALRLAISARLEEGKEFADADQYLERLRSGDGDDELRRLLPLVTVGKTSFFRDERQFEALRELLPKLLRRPRSTGRLVAIWSAGCATGEEPYSIAMTLAESGVEPEGAELLATDVNPDAVAYAERGGYETRRLHHVPEKLRERYFEAATPSKVRPALRRYLTAVRQHNLVSPVFPRPFDGGGWDVIFCRNVLIYFDSATIQRVLGRLHESLAPGGYLFLGYSESLFRVFEGFELVEVKGAFVYRRPETSAIGLPVPRAGRATARDREARPLLTHATPRGAREPRSLKVLEESTRAPKEFLDQAIDLFASGAFGAARELLERWIEKGGENLAVRLTLANLYGILRQEADARACYVAALALEPLSAEAHLFYGIHLISAKTLDAAALELQRALFLDPDLVLAHYYLGRCRESQRDPPRARLSYRNALEAYRRQPDGKHQVFLGYYPDLPEDGSAFARAAEYALGAL